MSKIKQTFAAFAFLALVACGDATLPVAPTVDESPAAPQQTVLGLALTARLHGALAISVPTDVAFTVEVGARCANPDLTCPRPNKIRWGVSGAFCELLGDDTGPSIVVKCRGFGVTRVNAVDLERPDVKGELQIEVTPVF